MIAQAPASELYLTRLSKALGTLSKEEREEILSDLRSLVLENAEQGQGEAAVLARLGPPEALAETYRTERLLSEAVRTSAPGAILSALLRWALLGVGGFFGSLALFFCYAMAFALVAIGLLKPIFPGNVGLWPSSHSFGALWPRPAGPEVLGYWIIPVTLGTGVLLYVLATRVLRLLLSATRKHLQLPIAERP